MIKNANLTLNLTQLLLIKLSVLIIITVILVIDFKYVWSKCENAIYLEEPDFCINLNTMHRIRFHYFTLKYSAIYSTTAYS